MEIRLDMYTLGSHGCRCCAIRHADGTVSFEGHCPSCMADGEHTPLWAGAAHSVLEHLAQHPDDWRAWERTGAEVVR